MVESPHTQSRCHYPNASLCEACPDTSLCVIRWCTRGTALLSLAFACFDPTVRRARQPETSLIMTDATKCPNCQSEHAYQDRDLWMCPECGHEWSATAAAAADAPVEAGVRDAHGNVLTDGDSVI